MNNCFLMMSGHYVLNRLSLLETSRIRMYESSCALPLNCTPNGEQMIQNLGNFLSKGKENECFHTLGAHSALVWVDTIPCMSV